MWRLCSCYADDVVFFTDLRLSFGDVVEARGPEQEVARSPHLLVLLFQVQGALEVRNDDGWALEMFLVRRFKGYRMQENVGEKRSPDSLTLTRSCFACWLNPHKHDFSFSHM